MRNLFLPFAVSSAIALSGVANAKDGAYVSAFGGAMFGSNAKSEVAGSYDYTATMGAGATGTFNASSKLKLKTAMPFGIAAGYNFQDFSFDLSYTNFSAKTKDDGEKLTSQFYLANAYYNIPVSHNVIKPYVGLGLAQSKIADYKTKNAFAYQLVAGSKFNVHEKVQLFADLRYTAASKARIKNFVSETDTDPFGNIETINDVKIATNYYSVNAGVSYTF